MQYENEYDLSNQYDRGLQAVEAKSSFITRVYTKLALSILALAGIEAAVFGIVGAEKILAFTESHLLAMGLVFLAMCVAGPFISNAVLASNPSRPTQYGLLAFNILIEATFLFPLLAVAGLYFGSALIWQACGLTASLFIALSAAVFVTRIDFSFLRSFLTFCGFAALILIAAALLFGFHLGMWFTIAVIFLACGYILYDTSVMMRYAEPDDDIICTINLFTSVMTLFFYILRLLMELNRN